MSGSETPSGALYAQALLQNISDTPTKGSWQYGTHPDPDGGWSVYASPPDSDQWHGPLIGSKGLDLGAAIRRMHIWRQQGAT